MKHTFEFTRRITSRSMSVTIQAALDINSIALKSIIDQNTAKFDDIDRVTSPFIRRFRVSEWCHTIALDE